MSGLSSSHGPLRTARRPLAAFVLLLALTGCKQFAVVKWGVDLCVAVAPPTATPAEVQAVVAKCGEDK